MSKQIPVIKDHWLKGSMDSFRGNPFLTMTKMAIEHGPILKFRILHKQFYLVSGSEYVHEVLVKQAKKFNKSDMDKRILGRVIGKGLLTSDGDFHRKQRKLAQPAFHHQRINNYAEIMVDYSEKMLANWQNGETRDMKEEMTNITMYIVAKTLFDADVGKESKIVGDAVHTFQELVNTAFERPIQLPEWLPHDHNRRFKAMNKTMLDVLLPIIQTRQASTEDHGDLLSMLINARDEDGNPMPEQQLLDETITLFLAGHETTSNSLTWALYLISQHPEVEAKLHEEVDKVLNGRLPTLTDLPNLPYLQKVVKETMRHTPAVWVLNIRQPTEDININGHIIPKGSHVFVSPYVNHHLPQFWDNPDQFDPDRFSDGFEDSLPKFAYMPFGGGPRVCIGNSFAMMEAQLILATIAQRYRLTLDPTQEVDYDPRITLSPMHGMRMKIEARVAEKQPI